MHMFKKTEVDSMGFKPLVKKYKGCLMNGFHFQSNQLCILIVVFSMCDYTFKSPRDFLFTVFKKEHRTR